MKSFEILYEYTAYIIKHVAAREITKWPSGWGVIAFAYTHILTHSQTRTQSMYSLIRGALSLINTYSMAASNIFLR